MVSKNDAFPCEDAPQHERFDVDCAKLHCPTTVKRDLPHFSRPGLMPAPRDHIRFFGRVVFPAATRLLRAVSARCNGRLIVFCLPIRHRSWPRLWSTGRARKNLLGFLTRLSSDPPPPVYSSGLVSILCEPHAEHFMCVPINGTGVCQDSGSELGSTSRSWPCYFLEIR